MFIVFQIVNIVYFLYLQIIFILSFDCCINLVLYKVILCHINITHYL